MGAPVVHFEIMGGEESQLETFYHQLFGWKINSNNPMKYGIVETGGGPGGINGGVGPANDGSKRVSVYARWKICRQRLTGWNTLEARQSFRPPKYREAPSWPCSPILQAISQDFL